MGEIVAWLNNWQFFGIQEYWGVGFRHLCPTRMEVIWECSSVEKNTTARGSDSKFASLCVGRSEYTEQQGFDTHQSFEVVASLTFALAVFVAQSFAVPRCDKTWGDTLRPLKPHETPLFWPKFSLASASFHPHPSSSPCPLWIVFSGMALVRDSGDLIMLITDSEEPKIMPPHNWTLPLRRLYNTWGTKIHLLAAMSHKDPQSTFINLLRKFYIHCFN